MASAIDPTKPPHGNALTQEVRDNFSNAKNEIEALQDALALTDAHDQGQDETINAAAANASNAITDAGTAAAAAATAQSTANTANTAAAAAQTTANNAAATANAALPSTGNNQTTGTWTPAPTNLTVVGTPSYSGKYVKRGKMVMWWMAISATTHTSSTGNSTSFTGLPFAPADNYAHCISANSNAAQTGIGLVSQGGVIFTPTWTASVAQFVTGHFFTT